MGSVPERHDPALCTQGPTHAGNGNLSTSPISVTISSSNVKLTINLSETGSFKQNTPLNYYITVHAFVNKLTAQSRILIEKLMTATQIVKKKFLAFCRT
jgi:hypothetical protein